MRLSSASANRIFQLFKEHSLRWVLFFILQRREQAPALRGEGFKASLAKGGGFCRRQKTVGLVLWAGRVSDPYEGVRKVRRDVVIPPYGGVRWFCVCRGGHRPPAASLALLTGELAAKQTERFLPLYFHPLRHGEPCHLPLGTRGGFWGVRGGSKPPPLRGAAVFAAGCGHPTLRGAVVFAAGCGHPALRDAEKPFRPRIRKHT